MHILVSHPQHQLGGVAPFAGDSVKETFNAVVRANLRFSTRIFRYVSKEAKDLLRKMLYKDVSRRLSAEQVLGVRYNASRWSSCFSPLAQVSLRSHKVLGLTSGELCFSLELLFVSTLELLGGAMS
ncbi:hypothetical protein Droror1_Dr00015043 [Drosera rotundifolia]